MQFSKQYKSWIFPACVAAAYFVVWLTLPDRLVAALKITKTITIEVALPLLMAFSMMFLLNLYISAAHITRFMGKTTGIRGMIFSSLAGIVSMGPIFAWFPFLKTLKLKNMPDIYLANFLSSRAVKPILLPILTAYFGLKFSLIFTIMCLVAAWGGSFIVALILAPEKGAGP